MIEEPTQFGGDGTVLTTTVDEVSDVIRWNYTSRSSVLVMHASGRHGNRCGRGIIADVYYLTVGKFDGLNSCVTYGTICSNIFLVLTKVFYPNLN